MLPRGQKHHLDEQANSRSIQRAINVNLAINVVLLAAKIFVVLLSKSISLLASTVDSAMDLLSTLIIAGTAWWISHEDWKTGFAYPVGKRRLEPVSIVVFSVFMQASCAALIP